MPHVVLETPESLREFVGKEIGVSDWLTITQDRIAKFADVTEDRQWIHLDIERSEKESPFKTTIAHGFLTLSLISHLMKQAVHIRGGIRLAVNYGLNRVRFPSPVREGSRIRGHFTLSELKNPSGVHEATFSVSIETEGSEKPCCVAECIIRYYT